MNVVFRGAAITYNKKLESVGRKVDVVRLIAQKIAYQWYSNLISPTWWLHAWLFEGLITLLATDAINEVGFLKIFLALYIAYNPVRNDNEINSMSIPLHFSLECAE